LTGERPQSDAPFSDKGWKNTERRGPSRGHSKSRSGRPHAAKPFDTAWRKDRRPGPRKPKKSEDE